MNLLGIRLEDNIRLNNILGMSDVVTTERKDEMKI